MTAVTKKSLVNQVHEVLHREISAGVYPAGSRLATVRELAARFDTGVRTVHQALALLEQRGLIVKKHGSGTLVVETCRELTLADTVLLCMEMQGHVFGELCGMLQRELEAHEKIPICLDSATPQFGLMLRRVSVSHARFVVVHGSRYFPFDLLQSRAFAGKTLIGVLDWEAPGMANPVHRVLVDHAEGGRLMAGYLHAAGHQRVMLAGNPMMVAAAQQPLAVWPHTGSGFVAAWRGYEGALEMCRVREGGDSIEGPEADELMARLSRPDAPTAIAALMDTNAAWIRAVLSVRAPGLLGSVEMIGYGDTPWSQVAGVPFSSVALNLSTLAQETCRIIEQVSDGRLEGPGREPIMIPPRLVIRGAHARIGGGV